MFGRGLSKKEDRILDTLAQVFDAYSECVSITEIDGEFYLSANEFIEQNNDKKPKNLLLIEGAIRIIQNFLIKRVLDEEALNKFVNFRQERKLKEEKREEENSEEDCEYEDCEYEEDEQVGLAESKKVGNNSLKPVDRLFKEVVYPIVRPKIELKQAASRLTSDMYKAAIEHAKNNEKSLKQEYIKDKFGHEQSMPAFVFFGAMEQWSNLRKAIDYFSKNKIRNEEIKNINFVYDTKKSVHAEMKILNEILKQIKNKSNKHNNVEIYVGLSKACCFHCHWTLEAAKTELKGKNINLAYRGSHDISFVKNKNNPNVKWYFPEVLRSTNLNDEPLYEKIKATAYKLFIEHENSNDASQAHSWASASDHDATSFEDYMQYLKSWREKLSIQLKTAGENDQLNEERKMLSFGERLSKIRFFEELFSKDSIEIDATNDFLLLKQRFLGNKGADKEEEKLFCDFLKNSNYSSSTIREYFSDIDIRELMQRPAKRQKLGAATQEQQEYTEDSISVIQVKNKKSIMQNKTKSVDTIPDGNCAFNAFALGVRDLALYGDSFELPEEFQNKLGLSLRLEKPVENNFKSWLERTDGIGTQKKLQFLLREVAVDFILNNYENFYKDVYQQQLCDAYRNKENDDTFVVHEHIEKKFSEVLSEEQLLYWWEQFGKGIYFSNLRETAKHAGDKARWGSEPEISALACYFKINVLWKKQSDAYGYGERALGIGGGLIKDLPEDQRKLLVNLNIGETVGNNFIINNFGSKEELEKTMNGVEEPLNGLLLAYMEKVSNDNRRVPLSIDGVSLDQSKIVLLRGKGIVTDQNKFIGMDATNLDKDGIRQRISGILDEKLRRNIFENFKNRSIAFSLENAGNHWQYLRIIESKPIIFSDLSLSKQYAFSTLDSAIDETPIQSSSETSQAVIPKNAVQSGIPLQFSKPFVAPAAIRDDITDDNTQDADILQGYQERLGLSDDQMNRPDILQAVREFITEISKGSYSVKEHEASWQRLQLKINKLKAQQLSLKKRT